MTATSLTSFLDRAASLWPGRTAITDGETRMDWAEFAARVHALAAALAARGVGRGDRVATWCDNRWELLALHFAAPWLGAVLVPGNTRLTAAEHRAILSRARPRVLCLEPKHSKQLAAVLESASVAIDTVLWLGGNPPPGLPGEPFGPLCEPGGDRVPAWPTTFDDVAQLYFTSGTTGVPKGVMLTHGNVFSHSLLAIAELQLRETDVWAHVAPMFHLADAWAIFAITAIGGRHAFLRRFEPAAALDLLVNESVSITNLVPTMLTRMVSEPSAVDRDYSALRLLLSGGAPIAPETVRAVVRTFRCRYVQTYGMTETSPYLTMSLLSQEQESLPESRRLAIAARTGRAVIGVELRIVDDSGRAVLQDDETVGEIQVRGPTVTPGYWEDPEATASAFTADGFLRTGDLATIDRTGSVRIVDRKKDVILTGGETVYSTEVEYRIHEHPSVLECAVYGTPDLDLGERVLAAVVLRHDVQLTESELIAFCRERLAGFKVPRSVRFLSELPRTGTGKVSKRVLREGAE